MNIVGRFEKVRKSWGLTGVRRHLVLNEEEMNVKGLESTAKVLAFLPGKM